MKKSAAWARRNAWDAAACLLFLLLAALILANLSMFPVYLDMPYHLAATRGFMDSGGVVTWDWWEFAPAGRPHIYPPLLHVLMSIPLGLGVSEQAVGTFFSLIMFPLVMLSMWWMMRRLFGPRQAFYSSLLLLVPYAFFRQAAVTTAASLVLALTPLIFLGLERRRWVTPSLLLAACLYTHLVLGHLAALALFLYMLHRREMWRRVLKVVAAAYILYLPWGVHVLAHLSSFSTSESGKGLSNLHLLIWMTALAALPLCYIRKGRHYLLPAYLMSMLPIVFFYPGRFWDGHALLPLAMLGGLFLDASHDALTRLFSTLPYLGKRGGGVMAAGVMVLASLALLLFDPVVAWGAGGGPDKLPKSRIEAVYSIPGPPGGDQGPSFPATVPPEHEHKPKLYNNDGRYLVNLPVPQGLQTQAKDLSRLQPQDGENYPHIQGKERDGGLAQVPPPPPGGAPGPPAAQKMRNGSVGINLNLRLTTVLELTVGNTAGDVGPGNGEMFSQDNLKLCRFIEENTGTRDIVFVADARLADLIFAMTGRPVSDGMFREVRPEERPDPAEAAVMVSPIRKEKPLQLYEAPQRPPQTPQGIDPGAVTLIGSHVVYLNPQAEAEKRPSSPVFPLRAAYLALALAGLFTALDWFFCRRGRGEGGEEDPAAPDEPVPPGLSPGEGGSASFLVAVPCLNEEGNIGRVVREVREAAPEARVLVVDDGSRDRTAEEAAGAGAVVVRNRRNWGVGSSLQRAFRLALASGQAWVVRLDGDGQHDPSFLSELLRPLQEGRADAVVGSRYLVREGPSDLSTTSLRRGSRRFFTAAVWLYTGRRFSDPNSGMWAFNRNAMRFLAGIDLLDYPEADMLIRLERKGLRVAEVPVCMRPRLTGKSSLRPSRALLHLVRLLFGPLFDPAGPAPYGRGRGCGAVLT